MWYVTKDEHSDPKNTVDGMFRPVALPHTYQLSLAQKWRRWWLVNTTKFRYQMLTAFLMNVTRFFPSPCFWEERTWDWGQDMSVCGDPNCRSEESPQCKEILALNGLDYSAINFLYMCCLESRGGKPKLVSEIMKYNLTKHGGWQFFLQT